MLDPTTVSEQIRGPTKRGAVHLRYAEIADDEAVGALAEPPERGGAIGRRVQAVAVGRTRRSALASWRVSLAHCLLPGARRARGGDRPHSSIAGIQITLGQAALALRDFGKGGLLSDRFDVEQGMSRVRRSLEALEGTAPEIEERQALGRARSLLDRLGQIEKEHIVRIDAGGGSMGMEKLAEIAHLRDNFALALTDFREVGVPRVVTAEPNPLSRLRRILGAIIFGTSMASYNAGASRRSR